MYRLEDTEDAVVVFHPLPPSHVLPPGDTPCLTDWMTGIALHEGMLPRLENKGQVSAESPA